MATGIGPAEAFELDAPMFDALELELAGRWSPELELAATAAELLSAQLAAFHAAHSKKGTPPLPVLRVPRPDRDASSSSDRVSSTGALSPAAFAAMFAGRTRGVG